MIRIIVVFTFLLVSCNNGCKQNNPPKTNSLTNSIINDPMLADSITPVMPKDTANLDEYSKDSLKLSFAFQRAANKLTSSFQNKDVATYATFTPPSIIKMYGGIEQYRHRVKEVFNADKTVFSRIVTGPVKRVKAALDDQQYGHGWYCLMPVRRFRKENGKEIMEIQWLGGQSLDMGKTIYFLDITGKSREQILQIMPDLHFVLDEEVLQ